MKAKITAVIGMMILLTAFNIRAQGFPGRWELVETLESGTAIVVKLQGGARINGVFIRIGPEEIIVAETKGKERRLPRTAISKIEMAAHIGDSLKNGTLIGTFVGAASGALAMIGYAKAVTNGPVDWGGEDGRIWIGAALVGAGIGAATGAIVDASIKKHPVLYQAK